MSEIIINITPEGKVVMVHTDAIDVHRLGKATTRRASHVEPTEDGKKWQADMSPVGGPVLGPHTFRYEALEAETEWLTKRLQRNEPLTSIAQDTPARLCPHCEERNEFIITNDSLIEALDNQELSASHLADGMDFNFECPRCDEETGFSVKAVFTFDQVHPPVTRDE